MAKAKPKFVTPAINIELLKRIADATVAGGFVYVSREEGEHLVTYSPQLIQVNTTMVEESTGKCAARATQEGINMINGGNTVPTEVAASPAASQFAIIENAVIPPSGKRGGKAGGAPSKYPFDQLEVGRGFFVPVSADMPDPVKKLGSSVSAANMKYANETGKKVVTRNKRGAKNKLVLDAAGQPIPETVEVSEYTHTRKFVVRRVTKGQSLGGWVVPEDGAFIAREK